MIELAARTYRIDHPLVNDGESEAELRFYATIYDSFGTDLQGEKLSIDGCLYLTIYVDPDRDDMKIIEDALTSANDPVRMAPMNYKSIPAALADTKPFEGSSMSASLDADGNYIVLSYDTEIARVTRDGEVVLNERKYSQTTSRHQTLCRENL